MPSIQSLRYSLERLKKDAARKFRRVEVIFHWPANEEEHQTLLSQYEDDPRVMLVLPEPQEDSH